MPARYSITNQRPLCWSMHLEPSYSGEVLLVPKMAPICTTGTLHMLVCSGRSSAFRPLFELLADSHINSRTCGNCRQSFFRKSSSVTLIVVTHLRLDMTSCDIM